MEPLTLTTLHIFIKGGKKMFTEGSKILFVEFKEEGWIRRYGLPLTQGMRNILRELENEEEVKIEFRGTAIVQHKMEGELPKEDLSISLKNIPSTPTAHYAVKFESHPDISDGTVIYSEELVNFLDELVISSPEKIEKHFEEPSEKEKKSKLADSLRSQLESTPQVEEPRQTTIDEYLPKEPIPEVVDQKQEKLDIILKRKKQEGSPASPDINQMIQEIHAAVVEQHTEVSGRDLAKWFMEYSYEHGSDRAWEHIASKISQW